MKQITLIFLLIKSIKRFLSFQRKVKSQFKKLDYELYHETYSKFYELYHVVEILQFAKVVNGELTSDLKDYCLYILGEFLEQFNNDFSKLLWTRIKFFIPSNKWTYLYTDKNKFPLPTVMGFEI